MTGLVGQVLLLAVLAGTVGLGGAGWVVGIASAAIVDTALAHGLVRSGSERLGPAGWVTLARATLAVGVAALTADSFDRPAPIATLVALAAVALVLDVVDGQVARRTGTASRLGARLDGEVDAFLILALSVYLAPSAGAWVLAIGAARYAFLAAGWPLRWLRAPLPRRDWRRVVAATQGVTLTVAAADVLPPGVTRAALAAALALLAGSFGHDVWWLWRRHVADRRPTDVDDGRPGPDAALDAGPGRGRVGASIAAVPTLLALLVVWVALLAPNHPSGLTPGAFVRVPLEAVVIVALALLLPPAVRRLLACVVGPALGLLVLVKLLDLGFFTAFDRPFNPVDDWTYASIGFETLRDSIGRTSAILAATGAALLGVAVLVLPTLAVLRLTRVSAGRRRPTLARVTAYGAASLLCWAVGAQLLPFWPAVSTSAADVAVHEVRAVRAGLQDRASFADDIRRDGFRDTPGDRLLTELRGKDVVVVFVESYGRVAVEGSSVSPRVAAVLDAGTSRLRAAGFSSQSGWLTSPTFGGLSWLAHSTLQSGLWVDGKARYDQLVASDRLTLSQAFRRAGWRAVGHVPANDRDWPEGSSFYHYDVVYDRRNVGYRGPTFAYASMPDQYVLHALQRLELAKPDRRPVFAEVDLVSSHSPWTRIPRLVDWSDVGDGSIFNTLPVEANPLRDARRAYGRSIEYSLNAMFSFVERYGRDDLVLLVLGDHQPAARVSGHGAGHDVPVSVIARDPAVLDRIAAWGWAAGMRPGPTAPVWPMNAFRDRFLSAFGSRPTPS